MPFTPPPSTLRSRSPAVGGFRRTSKSALLPQHMQFANVKECSSVILVRPNVRTQKSQIECRHLNTCSGRRRRQIAQNTFVCNVPHWLLMDWSSRRILCNSAAERSSSVIAFQCLVNSRDTYVSIWSRKMRCAAVISDFGFRPRRCSKHSDSCVRKSASNVSVGLKTR